MRPLWLFDRLRGLVFGRVRPPEPPSWLFRPPLARFVFPRPDGFPLRPARAEGRGSVVLIRSLWGLLGAVILRQWEEVRFARLCLGWSDMSAIGFFERGVGDDMTTYFSAG